MSGGHDPLDSSALTVAVATFAGVTGQVLGRHLRLPGIVVLLGLGVALGPDGADVVRPATLGEALQILVGFAVAIILFEGGLALNINRLRRAQRPVQRLVTVGAVVTLIVGTLVAKLAMGWPWKVSFLFGALIIVTGPTVVTPLLRRFQVEPRVATVLEAEGVLIDAVGAVTAAVALEVALSPTSRNVAAGFLSLASSLGFGVIAGVIGGALLALMLRAKRLIPDGFENIFALGFILALFQVTNAVFHESGIAAVTVAGIVLARTKLSVHQELHHFKEQLTSMLIGMLFILLAADVRLSDVQALGWPGVIAVLGVMVIVRPLNVAAGTFGSTLSTNQRLFIAWIGPRGIIAAAVAALFAGRLGQIGMTEGRALQALVFSVIAVTVLWAGLTGGFVAQRLGLRRPSDTGWVFFGANDLAVLLARALRDGGEAVMFIESDPQLARDAEQEGFRTIFANPFESRTLQRAEMALRTGVIALSRSTETNYLFAQRAKRLGNAKQVLMAAEGVEGGVTEDMLHHLEVGLWTGAYQDVDRWTQRVRQRKASQEYWKVTSEAAKAGASQLHALSERGLLVPLVRRRAAKVLPFDGKTELKADDQLMLLLPTEQREEASSALQEIGYERVA